MQAIELPVEIDENHQIHVQLPNTVQAKTAKVIVMYEDIALSGTDKQPIKLGLFQGLIDTPDDFNEPLPDDFWLGATVK